MCKIYTTFVDTVYPIRYAQCLSVLYMPHDTHGLSIYHASPGEGSVVNPVHYRNKLCAADSITKNFVVHELVNSTPYIQ